MMSVVSSTAHSKQNEMSSYHQNKEARAPSLNKNGQYVAMTSILKVLNACIIMASFPSGFLGVVFLEMFMFLFFAYALRFSVKMLNAEYHTTKRTIVPGCIRRWVRNEGLSNPNTWSCGCQLIADMCRYGHLQFDDNVKGYMYYMLRRGKPITRRMVNHLSELGSLPLLDGCGDFTVLYYATHYRGMAIACLAAHSAHNPSHTNHVELVTTDHCACMTVMLPTIYSVGLNGALKQGAQGLLHSQSCHAHQAYFDIEHVPYRALRTPGEPYAAVLVSYLRRLWEYTRLHVAAQCEEELAAVALPTEREFVKVNLSGRIEEYVEMGTEYFTRKYHDWAGALDLATDVVMGAMQRLYLQLVDVASRGIISQAHLVELVERLMGPSPRIFGTLDGVIPPMRKANVVQNLFERGLDSWSLLMWADARLWMLEGTQPTQLRAAVGAWITTVDQVLQQLAADEFSKWNRDLGMGLESKLALVECVETTLEVWGGGEEAPGPAIDVPLLVATTAPALESGSAAPPATSPEPAPASAAPACLGGWGVCANIACRVCRPIPTIAAPPAPPQPQNIAASATLATPVVVPACLGGVGVCFHVACRHCYPTPSITAAPPTVPPAPTLAIVPAGPSQPAPTPTIAPAFGAPVFRPPPPPPRSAIVGCPRGLTVTTHAPVYHMSYRSSAVAQDEHKSSLVPVYNSLRGRIVGHGAESYAWGVPIIDNAVVEPRMAAVIGTDLYSDDTIMSSIRDPYKAPLPLVSAGFVAKLTTCRTFGRYATRLNTEIANGGEGSWFDSVNQWALAQRRPWIPRGVNHRLLGRRTGVCVFQHGGPVDPRTGEEFLSQGFRLQRLVESDGGEAVSMVHTSGGWKVDVDVTKLLSRPRVAHNSRWGWKRVATAERVDPDGRSQQCWLYEAREDVQATHLVPYFPYAGSWVVGEGAQHWARLETRESGSETHEGDRFVDSRLDPGTIVFPVRLEHTPLGQRVDLPDGVNMVDGRPSILIRRAALDSVQRFVDGQHESLMKDACSLYRACRGILREKRHGSIGFGYERHAISSIMHDAYAYCLMSLVVLPTSIPVARFFTNRSTRGRTRGDPLDLPGRFDLQCWSCGGWAPERHRWKAKMCPRCWREQSTPSFRTRDWAQADSSWTVSSTLTALPGPVAAPCGVANPKRKPQRDFLILGSDEDAPRNKKGEPKSLYLRVPSHAPGRVEEHRGCGFGILHPVRPWSYNKSQENYMTALSNRNFARPTYEPVEGVWDHAKTLLVSLLGPKGSDVVALPLFPHAFISDFMANHASDEDSLAFSSAESLFQDVNLELVGPMKCFNDVEYPECWTESMDASKRRAYFRSALAMARDQVFSSRLVNQAANIVFGAFNFFLKVEWNENCAPPGSEGPLPDNPRIICAPDLRTHLLAGPRLKALTNDLHCRWGLGAGLTYAGGMTPSDLTMWLNRVATEDCKEFKPKGPSGRRKAFCSDFATFDNSHSLASFSYARSAYRWMGLPLGQKGFEYLDAVFHYWQQPSGTTPIRHYLQAPVMNASGRDDTALLNALLNGTCQLMCVAAQYHRVPIVELTHHHIAATLRVVDLIVLGDDSLCVVPELDVYGRPISLKEHQDLLSLFGFEAKVAAEHYEPRQADFLAMRPFPAMKFGRRIASWAPVLGRRLYKHHWWLKPSGDAKKWLAEVSYSELVAFPHVPLLSHIASRTLKLTRTREFSPDGVGLTDNPYSPWYRFQALQLDPVPEAMDVLADVYGVDSLVMWDLVAHVGDVVSLPVVLSHYALDRIFAKDLGV